MTAGPGRFGSNQNAKKATTRASERVNDDDNVRTVTVRVVKTAVAACCLFAGCLPEDVRDVSAILTRDVVRASPTSHNGALGEDASRDVARGFA